jgi:hypothetical protein
MILHNILGDKSMGAFSFTSVENQKHLITQLSFYAIFF